MFASSPIKSLEILFQLHGQKLNFKADGRGPASKFIPRRYPGFEKGSRKMRPGWSAEGL
jgi:hypothetical protein